MPQRTISELDCADELLDRLTAEEERFYKRLLTASDDYGLFDARPKVLRSECWKLNPELVTTEDIERWLQGMAAKGVIQLYTVVGERYGKCLVWRTSPRAKRPKFPEPGSGSDTSSQGSAEPPAEVPAAATSELQLADGNAPVRQTPEYREFERFCNDNGMEQWTREMPFMQLYRQATSVTGRSWTVLHEVAKHASLVFNRSPSPKRGLDVLNDLPASILTREAAAAFFEERRSGSSRPAPLTFVPTDDDEDPRDRLRRERAAIGATANAAT